MSTLTWPADFHTFGNLYVPVAPKDFNYSDGSEAEEQMLRDVLAAPDLRVLSPDMSELMENWPTRYHFSPRRANLLRPLNFQPGTKVLEVGAGCGAISRYLGEAGLDVTGVEGSLVRAKICAARTRDLPNVQIAAANFLEMSFHEQFDVVVLIGVLEYAGEYDDSPGSHANLLRKCRNLLTEKGVLVLGIENRLGLKYLAGVAEDHTGKAYMGINASYPTPGPRTFTKTELVGLIEEAGFGSMRVLTPLPDYKLVRAVVDLERAPKEALLTIGQMSAATFYEDQQLSETPPFSLEQASRSVIESGLGTDLGNSFLVVASNSSGVARNLIPEGEFAWHFAVERAPGFRKVTALTSEDGVLGSTQRKLPDDSTPVTIGEDGLLEQRLVHGPLLVGEPVWLALVSVVNQAGWTISDAAESLAGWSSSLGSHATISPSGPTVPGHFLDATPYNSVLGADGRATFFDLEWVWSGNLPLAWVALRGVLYSVAMITSCAQSASEVPETLFELAKSLLDELVGGFEIDDEEFFTWLAVVQASASGATASGARRGVDAVCSATLKRRVEPKWIDVLAFEP